MNKFFITSTFIPRLFGFLLFIVSDLQFQYRKKRGEKRVWLCTWKNISICFNSSIFWAGERNLIAFLHSRITIINNHEKAFVISLFSAVAPMINISTFLLECFEAYYAKSFSNHFSSELTGTTAPHETGSASKNRWTLRFSHTLSSTTDARRPTLVRKAVCDQTEIDGGRLPFRIPCPSLV